MHSDGLIFIELITIEIAGEQVPLRIQGSLGLEFAQDSFLEFRIEFSFQPQSLVGELICVSNRIL